MSLLRVVPLGAFVTLTVLVGSSVARADVSPPSDAGAGTCNHCDAGDAGASDPPDGTSVGGGGGCSIGLASTPELEPFGFFAGGAALLAASRRRRTR
ncbi:MAG TPA: hypothetical protein VF765_01495 [Polyangiaceae bacterium]